MEVVKQFLAFPLYATVAWLFWVLIREVGPDATLAALFGLVLVGFALWIYGRTRFSAPPGRRLGTGVALAGTIGVIFLAASFTTAESGAVPTRATAQTGLVYEPFSRQRLAELLWPQAGPEGARNSLRQLITVKEGIDSDLAKKLVKAIKDAKMKVQAAIQGDSVRVSGAKRDDLQAAMALIRSEMKDLPLSFDNFRD